MPVPSAAIRAQPLSVVLSGAGELVGVLVAQARDHRDTICIGRTHGVHAEPTTFGLKLAGYAFEAERNRLRLEAAFAQLAVGKLSGAVGTYSTLDPTVEKAVIDAVKETLNARETMELLRISRETLRAMLASRGSRSPRGACVS